MLQTWVKFSVDIAMSCGLMFLLEDPFHPPHPHMSAPPHIKPEDYDSTFDRTEYQIYFDHLSELYGWEDERKAMVLVYA